MSLGDNHTDRNQALLDYDILRMGVCLVREWAELWTSYGAQYIPCVGDLFLESPLT